MGKIHKPPSNYHQIDNIPPKLSIVTMSLTNYQNIVNVLPNDETKKLKKSKGWKIKKK
jgi:hypothetical protein